MAVYGLCFFWLWGGAGLVCAAGLGLCLMALSIVDIQTYRLPDPVQILLLGFAAFCVWDRFGYVPAEHIIAGVLWAAVMFAIAFGFRLRTGRDGLGFGDAKLMGTIGFLLGFRGAGIVLAVAALAGLAVSIGVARLRGEGLAELRARPVAFGPFLCLAAWVYWLLYGVS